MRSLSRCRRVLNCEVMRMSAHFAKHTRFCLGPAGWCDLARDSGNVTRVLVSLQYRFNMRQVTFEHH